jgi:hypothetical protein
MERRGILLRGQADSVVGGIGKASAISLSVYNCGQLNHPLVATGDLCPDVDEC